LGTTFWLLLILLASLLTALLLEPRAGDDHSISISPHYLAEVQQFSPSFFCPLLLVGLQLAVLVINLRLLTDRHVRSVHGFLLEPIMQSRIQNTDLKVNKTSVSLPTCETLPKSGCQRQAKRVR
jgi:hypothetical protein